MKWKLPVGLLVVVAILGALWASGLNLTHAKTAWAKLVAPDEKTAEAKAKPAPSASRGEFDGMIRLTPRQTDSIGLTFVPVQPQTLPMLLAVNGRTDYDPNTLTKVRPKFKSLIDKVYVGLGQEVKAGDPLVELFSAELAKAKGDYEAASTKFERDKIELKRSRELLKSQAIAEKDVLQNESDEKTSEIAVKIAKDSLMVFGLTEAEIAASAKEDGIQKARMTLRAPASGVVINRDAVKGNIYDDNDVLLTIAPLDHFWVHGYIYPSDANRVRLGLGWVIHCDTIGTDVRRTVDSITSEIDPETHTLKIRTQIDNVKGRVKANMLVRGELEIPPAKTHTVIPRLAMVSADGGDYVFIRHPGDPSKDQPDRYSRQKIRVIQEKNNEVIVGDSLQPGQEVAARGSLLLMQLYEDQAGSEGAKPLAVNATEPGV